MQRKERSPEMPNSFEEILAQERVSSIYIYPQVPFAQRRNFLTCFIMALTISCD
jgi:hypothetical protein